MYGHGGDAGAVLDAEAVAAYRRRFHDLQEEVARGASRRRRGMLAKAQDELDALTEQLAGGLGLGGRHRRAGSPAERARLPSPRPSAPHWAAGAGPPELGGHLRRTVRTGTFCSYAGETAWGREVAGDAPRRRRRRDRTPFVGRPWSGS